MKKALILSLSLLLVIGLTLGCTPAESTTIQTTSGDGTTSSDATTLGSPAEITYVYPALTGEQVDQQMVADAINEISEATINVSAELMPISIANYATQVSLMITGNEDMDLLRDYAGRPVVPDQYGRKRTADRYHGPG